MVVRNLLNSLACLYFVMLVVEQVLGSWSFSFVLLFDFGSNSFHLFTWWFLILCVLVLPYILLYWSGGFCRCVWLLYCCLVLLFLKFSCCLVGFCYTCGRFVFLRYWSWCFYHAYFLCACWISCALEVSCICVRVVRLKVCFSWACCTVIVLFCKSIWLVLPSFSVETAWTLLPEVFFELRVLSNELWIVCVMNLFTWLYSLGFPHFTFALYLKIYATWLTLVFLCIFAWFSPFFVTLRTCCLCFGLLLTVLYFILLTFVFLHSFVVILLCCAFSSLSCTFEFFF